VTESSAASSSSFNIAYSFLHIDVRCPVPPHTRHTPRSPSTTAPAAEFRALCKRASATSASVG
jgi:hypothetical protein